MGEALKASDFDPLKRREMLLRDMLEVAEVGQAFSDERKRIDSEKNKP